MKIVLCWAVIALAASTRAATTVKLPEYMKLCSRNDPELNVCLKKNLQSLLPKLTKGVPEFSLLPLDPFYIPETVVNYEQGGINTKIVTSNLYCYGIQQVRVQDVRSVLNDTHLYMEVDVKFPRILIEGDVNAHGKVVVFDLDGGGPFNISMTDVTATWKLTGETVSKAGEKHMKIQHFTMKPRVGTLKFHSGNLVPENERLNDAAVAFANEFWPMIYNELLPFVQDAWDQVMTLYANKVFLKVPYKQLFPSS